MAHNRRDMLGLTAAALAAIAKALPIIAGFPHSFETVPVADF